MNTKPLALVALLVAVFGATLAAPLAAQAGAHEPRYLGTFSGKGYQQIVVHGSRDAAKAFAKAQAKTRAIGAAQSAAIDRRPIAQALSYKKIRYKVKVRRGNVYVSCSLKAYYSRTSDMP